MDNIVLSEQARAAMKVAEDRHWRFQFLGYGAVPEEPFYYREWWYMPATEIPEDGQRRINALKKAGVPISGLVIAHETPKMLMAPQETTVPAPVQAASSIPTFDGSSMLEGVLFALGLVCSAAFQALLVDPALIIVLPDGEWISVLTWL